MKILLFGSNGMLGRYFLTFLSQFHEVVPITRKEYDANTQNIQDLDNLVKTYGTETVIINCVGVIPQRGGKDYIRVNSEFPHLLNAVAKRYGCEFIHVTTDCVFNGSKGQYDENDAHTETGIYGHSKSLGEPGNATVIRTSIIGEEVENKKSLLEWVKSQNGTTINGFVNHFWNGVTCLQLAKIVNKIITEDLYWHGVRHIFSPVSVSKFQLVEMIGDVYKLDITINPVSAVFSDKTLTSIYKNICTIPPLEEQIKELKTFSLT